LRIDAESVLPKGFNSMICKPITIEKMKQLVEKVELNPNRLESNSFGHPKI
jgi:hypothetical protein